MTDLRPSPLERLAAVVALVALAAGVIVLAVAAVDNAGALAMLFAGLIVTVVGAWFGLTHRGALRVIAAVVVVAGVGLLIAGFVVADLRAARIAAVVALAIVSVASARVALRKGDRPAQNGEAAVVAPSPAHPVLIMNPKSGGGKAERFRLVEECERRGIEPVVLGPGDDLLRLAELAVERGADVIGMAGGDGSQALVASVAIRHGLPHVVVPAGTRNHFALDLGLDRDDVVGALDAFADGVERRIDLASVNDRIFVNNATLGLYARIVQAPEYRGAKRETATAMLPDLLGPDAERLDLRFTGPDGSQHTTADVILVSNNPYELTRFAGRGTRARLDTGTLGIAVATIRNATEAAQLLTLQLAGRIGRFRGWHEWAGDRFVVDSDGPVDIGIDGEALTMEPPLRFVSMPGALRVRVPRRKVGLSPAARAVHVLSRSTVVDLVRVSAGQGFRG